MSKNLLIIILALVCGSVALAQNDYHKFEVSGGYSISSNDGFNGDQFTSTNSLSTSTLNTKRRENLNGFNASAAYNFSRYLGAKVEVAGHYGNGQTINVPGGSFRLNGGTGAVLVVPNTSGITTRLNQHNFLGGIQIKDNSKEKRVKPFGQFLAGVAIQKTKYTNISQQFAAIIGRNSIEKNSLALSMGGGLDVRIHQRIDIRIIQFDYNPVFVKSQRLRSDGSVFDSQVTTFGQISSLQNIDLAKRTQHNFRIGFGIVFH